MFKKLVYVFLLLLAFIIAACGSGVATYPPPDKTGTFEAALSDESLASEPTEQAALPTESSHTDADVEDTVEPTPIDDATIEPTVDESAATIIVEETNVPSEVPPTAVEALPSEVATELPEVAATEPVSTSRAEVATIASSDTPERTATVTSTATDTPEPTATASDTVTNTPEPTATSTSTDTLEPYENESLGLTFDYSPAWNEPIEDDNAIIIIPSEDIEDTTVGNVTILRGTPQEIADEFIVEVNIDSPEAFLESLADDLEDAEVSEVELADGDITATELIGVSEEENQTIRAIVVDLEDEWIVIIGIAPTESFDEFSTNVMDIILQNLDIGEREISEPVESAQYEGEAVGLEFEYQEDSEIERDGNTLTIASTFGDVNGSIFIARGTPEDLLEQGHISDDSNPRAALLSLEPDTDPFVSDQFNPSFQAWTINIETTDGDDTYTERLYIVAIRSEWVFIRTSALSDDFDDADQNIFAPLLESVIILDEIPE